MNLQKDRYSTKEKKVNTLADRSEIDVSCDIDTESVAKLNDFRKTESRPFFLEIIPILYEYW